MQVPIIVQNYRPQCVLKGQFSFIFSCLSLMLIRWTPTQTRLPSVNDFFFLMNAFCTFQGFRGPILLRCAAYVLISMLNINLPIIYRIQVSEVYVNEKILCKKNTFQYPIHENLICIFSYTQENKKNLEIKFSLVMCRRIRKKVTTYSNVLKKYRRLNEPSK